MKEEPIARPASALPLQTAAEEIAFLRQTFRELADAYVAQVEGEIVQLHSAITASAASKRKLPGSRVTDLRDILMMVRSLDVKPGKGRRRDLKKVELLVEELRAIVDRWE